MVDWLSLLRDVGFEPKAIAPTLIVAAGFTLYVKIRFTLLEENRLKLLDERLEEVEKICGLVSELRAEFKTLKVEVTTAVQHLSEQQKQLFNAVVDALQRNSDG